MMDLRILTLGLASMLGSMAMAQPYPVTVQGQVIPCTPAIAGSEIVISNIQEGITDTLTLDANCQYSASYLVDNQGGIFVANGSCGDGTSDMNSSQYSVNALGETLVSINLSCGPPPTDCEACMTMTSPAPFTADFSSSCSDGVTPYISQIWDFSDGGAVEGENVQHVYSAPGYYTVCFNLNAGNGCWDNICESVIVDADGNVYLMNSDCEADFQVTQATDGNNDPVPFQLDITNLSTGDGPIAYSWQLPLGETATDFEPAYTLPNTGQAQVYGICLNITTGNCTSWHCDSLYVLADGTLTDPFYFDCLGEVNGPAVGGTPCDDGDPDTIDDQWTMSCQCEGTALATDCEGVVNGPAQPGTPCDDGDPMTSDDTWTADCDCVGTTPNGPYWIMVHGHISPCTPGIAAGQVTISSVQGTSPSFTQTADLNDNCYYTATFLMDDPTGWFQVSAGCGDGTSDTNTGNYSINMLDGDTIVIDLECAGTVLDCEGTPNGPAQPGTACDDGNPVTSNDTWNADCECVGTSGPDDCEAGYWVIQAFDSADGQIEPIPYELWVWNLSTGGTGMQQTWDFGDGTTSTDAFPTHVYADSGPYVLCLTIWDNNGCTDTYCDTIVVDQDGIFNGMIGHGDDRNALTINVIQSMPTALDDKPAFDDLAVWPNPASELLNISVGSTIAGNTMVTIIDLNGRIVRTMSRSFNRGTNMITVPVADLADGMYTIRIDNAGNAINHRFVKNQ